MPLVYRTSAWIGPKLPPVSPATCGDGEPPASSEAACGFVWLRSKLSARPMFGFS